MTDWPSNLSVRRITSWPGALTPSDRRVVSEFRRTISVPGEYSQSAPMPLSSTLALLGRELGFIQAASAELQVAVKRDQFRLDGRPRAGSHAEHPGIILSFITTLNGPLTWACDTFTTWEDNLRATALSLEALRKVDFYGVVKHGEQYRGFSPAALSLPVLSEVGAFTFTAALDVLAVHGDGSPRYDDGEIGPLIRRALRATHPDNGGAASDFDAVTAAVELVRGVRGARSADAA